MDWAQILVILLAVLFAIFLVMAIILAVLLVKLTAQIKAAAASAERTVEALEGSVRTFSKGSLPIKLTKDVVSQIVKRSKGTRKDKDA